MNEPADEIYKLMSTMKHNNVTLNNMVGGGDPKIIGIDTHELLISFGAIVSDSVVFDIGCGCGRVAIEQGRFLTNGHYHGFDIIPPLIFFCNQYISPSFPNTTFYVSRAANELYSEHIYTVSEYHEFDEIDASPDLITAFSVFTHFNLDDAVNYFSRMRDKLKRGGSICISMFLLNDSSIKNIQSSRSSLIFSPSSQQGIIFGDQNNPLSRVAWHEDYLRTKLNQIGLEIHKIAYGNWSGMYSKYYQDYILLKPAFELPKDFDPRRYLELNPDLNPHGINPYHHYINYGRFETWRKYI